MRASILILLLALAGCSPQPQDLSGVWKSTSGTMLVRQAGDRVSGVYESPQGRFQGVLKDGVLAGEWVQVSSNRDCGVEREGSRFWGRFLWRVSQDGRRFAGSWAYCDDKPEFASGGVWVGEHVRTAP